MGEVYRARDTRLNRDVAVKILPASFAADPERLRCCLCAKLSGDGLLTIANAGHLAPYRNGEELPLPSGLPLGVTPDPNYTESTFALASGDQLTFLSDGVVEARDPKGELFGFDRTRNLSTHSAEQIAQTAQAFGQQDDISVLTLQFAPAEVLHA